MNKGKNNKNRGEEVAMGYSEGRKRDLVADWL